MFAKRLQLAFGIAKHNSVLKHYTLNITYLQAVKHNANHVRNIMIVLLKFFCNFSKRVDC